MHDVSLILLAAGQSSRMGTPNKLLLPVGEMPMVRHVALQYRAAFDGPILVVTGHDSEAVSAALADCDVECVFNPDHANGQQGSVAVGLKNAPIAELLLIGLGDQPLLKPRDILDLIEAHKAADPSKVSIPERDGARGNPIVVPHELRPQLTANPDRPGCMRFTRDNPTLVQRHALAADGFYADIDTPQEYAALRSRKEMAS